MESGLEMPRRRSHSKRRQLWDVVIPRIARNEADVHGWMAVGVWTAGTCWTVSWEVYKWVYFTRTHTTLTFELLKFSPCFRDAFS